MNSFVIVFVSVAQGVVVESTDISRKSRARETTVTPRTLRMMTNMVRKVNDYSFKVSLFVLRKNRSLANFHVLISQFGTIYEHMMLSYYSEWLPGQYFCWEIWHLKIWVGHFNFQFLLLFRFVGKTANLYKSKKKMLWASCHSQDSGLVFGSAYSQRVVLCQLSCSHCWFGQIL